MWESEGSNVGVRGLPLVGITIVLAMLLLAFAPRADAGSATFTARGSAEQVQVTGASPGQKLNLVTERPQVASKTAAAARRDRVPQGRPRAAATGSRNRGARRPRRP